jgi:hypothetical protein
MGRAGVAWFNLRAALRPLILPLQTPPEWLLRPRGDLDSHGGVDKSAALWAGPNRKLGQSTPSFCSDRQPVIPFAVPDPLGVGTSPDKFCAAERSNSRSKAGYPSVRHRLTSALTESMTFRRLLNSSSATYGRLRRSGSVLTNLIYAAIRKLVCGRLGDF